MLNKDTLQVAQGATMQVFNKDGLIFNSQPIESIFILQAKKGEQYRFDRDLRLESLAIRHNETDNTGTQSISISIGDFFSKFSGSSSSDSEVIIPTINYRAESIGLIIPKKSKFILLSGETDTEYNLYFRNIYLEQLI